MMRRLQQHQRRGWASSCSLRLSSPRALALPSSSEGEALRVTSPPFFKPRNLSNSAVEGVSSLSSSAPSGMYVAAALAEQPTGDTL